jgi:hypothetical protein
VSETLPRLRSTALICYIHRRSASEGERDTCSVTTHRGSCRTALSEDLRQSLEDVFLVRIVGLDGSRAAAAPDRLFGHVYHLFPTRTWTFRSEPLVTVFLAAQGPGTGCVYDYNGVHSAEDPGLNDLSLAHKLGQSWRSCPISRRKRSSYTLTWRISLSKTSDSKDKILYSCALSGASLRLMVRPRPSSCLQAGRSIQVSHQRCAIAVKTEGRWS